MSFTHVLRVSFLVAAFAVPAVAQQGALGWQKQAQIVSWEGDTVVLRGVRWGFRNNDLARAIFKDTTIRIDQVRDVYYYNEPFNVTGLSTVLNKFQAHGLLFFEMKDPDAIQGSDGTRDIGFGVSAEARRDTPQYSALKGFQKHYRLHYQVQTEKDRLQWGFTIWNERIQRYRLKLDEAQKRQLVRNAIEAACVDRSKEWYHAITNSCIASAARLMNTVLDADRQLTIWSIPRVWYNLKLGIPSRTPGYLMRRGVVEPGLEWKPDVEVVEFPTTSGTPYRIVLRDLPDAGASADASGEAAGNRAVEPPRADAGTAIELLPPPEAVLHGAPSDREDASFLEEIRSAKAVDVMLH